jgi:hypothetical protein
LLVDRDELDAFFARAEDVLKDWEPPNGSDAMRGRPPSESDKLPNRADSYYAQEAPYYQVNAVNAVLNWPQAGEITGVWVGDFGAPPRTVEFPDDGYADEQALERMREVLAHRDPAEVARLKSYGADLRDVALRTRLLQLRPQLLDQAHSLLRTHNLTYSQLVIVMPRGELPLPDNWSEHRLFGMGLELGTPEGDYRVAIADSHRAD